MAAIPTRVLETVLVGRNLLSPVLVTAGRDVAAFDTQVSGANARAAASAQGSAATQVRANTQIAASASQTAAKVATASAAMEAARKREADALGAVRVAEARLAQVQGSRTATDAQRIAAQEAVARAQRGVVAAQESATAASARLAAAQTGQVVSSGRVSAATVRQSATADAATLSMRAQASATQALVSSNGLLGTSLTPLTAGLGAVGLGLGFAAFRGMEFDSAMSAVQAASQASAGDMDRLREAAIDAGADTKYSAEEAAGGITALSKAGVSTADILNGGLNGALSLAAAGQMEVADAAEIGATALSVFRLEGDQMSHVADLLAAGAGKAQGSVHDLGEALNQSALVADQTGLSIEDTAGALAMFASNGLTGSDAGTSFKTMLQALNPNSEAAAKAMDAIGFSAYDAQGNFVGLEGVAGQLKEGLAGLTVEQQNATLKTIFGSDAVRAAAILYKEGSAGVREWRDNVNDAGYAQEQAAQLTDNLRGDLERMGGVFDSVMTEMGSGAQGPLREVVQMLTGLVEIGGDVLGFWNSLPGEVQAAVAIFGALTALKGPLDDVLGSAAGVIMRAQLRFSEAAAGTSSLSAAATSAKGAIGGLVRAAAPLAGIMVLTSAISSVVEFTRAGDDARQSVDAFNDGLREMGNTARGEAVAGEIDKIRDSIRGYQDFIDGYEGQNLFNKYVWAGIGEPGELKNADESIAALEGQLRNLERTSGTLASNTDVLAERFRLSKTEVQELADKYGIDLSDGVIIAQTAFQQMYEAEYGTTPTDATNALTGALVSAKTQTEEAIKAQEDWLESLQGIAAGFVEPLGAYQGLLDAKMAKERESAEATAAATEDSTDSWEDYATDVTVSLDELAVKLEEQLVAHDKWAKNIGVITQRGGEDVGRILASMGEEGVQIAAQMANGTDAEFNRMADLLKRGAQVAGMDAVTEFDYYMKMMQLVGASGGTATAKSVSDALGIGVDEVARIAGQYGVVLAEGVNPLLRGLGKSTIQVNGAGPRTAQSGGGVQGRNNADGNLYEEHQAEIAPGGAWRIWAEPETGGEAYIPLAAGKRARSLDIWRETGRRLDAPEAQYFAAGGFATSGDVPAPYSTAPKGPPISTAGDASMQKGFDEVRAWLDAHQEATQGGTAGAGAIAGTGWQPIWNYVKERVPQARINSTYRPGDPGRHGRGLAVDFGFGSGPGGAGSAGLALINRVLHDGIGGSLAELIYDGIGDDRPDLRMGKPHTYNAGTRAEHRNHVHAAREKGGPVWPGQNFLVGENGPEIARFDAPGMVYPTGTAPAAMPGYGLAGGPGGAPVIDYDRLARAITARERATVSVDARGYGADQIAKAIVRDQQQQDALAPAW